LISAFISNTATAAMLLPIGLGMMGALGGVWSATSPTRDRRPQPPPLRDGADAHDLLRRRVGGLLTPIGTPPNLIGIEFIEQETMPRSRSSAGC
jgi:sodium-dependent dicarboxylate transporter 2/3/5